MLTSLPSLPVDSLSKGQLTDFIPKLLSMANDQECETPQWWPASIPWAGVNRQVLSSLPDMKEEALREVVRSFYRHHQMEQLLLPARKILAENNPSVKPQRKALTEKPDVSSCSSIWVCFVCTMQFNCQAELMIHQAECERRAEEREKSATPSPVPLQMVACKTRKTCNLKRKRLTLKPEPYIPPPKVDFIQCLGLRESPKVEPSDRKPTLPAPSASVSRPMDEDSDCEITEIDLSAVPQTPRTPKSLISQLSRESEGGARRQRYSFSQLPPALGENDSSDDEEPKQGEVAKPTLAISSLLYNIDLTSHLGKRVRKHLKRDPSLSVITNVEDYCGSKKKEFEEKLRQRDNLFAVSFFKNKKRKLRSKYFHKYKFNRRDREEFKMILKTGLNRRSRKLLQCVKSCEVKLKRLKPEVIKEWTRRKPKPQLVRYFPLQYRPNFANRQGFWPCRFPFPHKMQTAYRQRTPMIRLSAPSMKPPSVNMMSLGMNMVTQIVTNSDGSTSMRMYPAQQAQLPARAVVSESKRKQSFERVKSVDDEVIIINLDDSDSDDSENAPQPSTSHATISTAIKSHRNKPFMGPACVKYGHRHLMSNLGTGLGDSVVNNVAAASGQTIGMQGSQRSKSGFHNNGISTITRPGVVTNMSTEANSCKWNASKDTSLLHIIPLEKMQSSTISSDLRQETMVSLLPSEMAPSKTYTPKYNSSLHGASTSQDLLNGAYPVPKRVVRNIHLDLPVTTTDTTTLGKHTPQGCTHSKELASSTMEKFRLQGPNGILNKNFLPSTSVSGVIPKKYSPVKTSVLKMQVSGEGKEQQFVDVICIDDD